MAKEVKNERVNKADFIAMYAEENSISKAEAGRIVDGVFDLMLDTLSAGKDLAFNGVFNMSVVDVPQRVINTPLAKNMVVEAHKKIKVKVSKPWQEAVK